MLRSPNNPTTVGRNDAILRDHERFIDRHRLILQRYLDGKTPASEQEPDALGYVESVLTEWQETFANSDLSDPSAVERTFWFALYLLEELVELPGSYIDPYEKLMMTNLAEARELLRHRRSLPEHRFIATRPDGT
jgi:hypothetical protein